MDKDTLTANTCETFAQAGLPLSSVGADGYPLPGKVVQYYRKQATYIDRDGRERHWTQADLARQLGITEIMVNRMENKNHGLDSIERRRTLSTILKIPPVLLGLGSLDDIVEIVTGQKAPIQQKEIDVEPATIQQYQNQYHIYDKLFAAGMTYDLIATIERQIKQLDAHIQNSHKNNKNTLLHILWKYEILCTKIYASDFAKWDKSFQHINNAIQIADELSDRDLQAVSMYTAGVNYVRQGWLGLAKTAIDSALMYAKGALPQTKGAIYSLEAFYHTERDGIPSSFSIQKLLDMAEQYAGAKSDLKTVKFGKGTFLFHKAQALIDLGRPGKALELLDDAERHISPTKKRMLVYLDIMRARCHIEQKKPEYEHAARILEETIGSIKEIRIARHIHHIERLYNTLVASSYGSSPDMADLGLALRELKGMK